MNLQLNKIMNLQLRKRIHQPINIISKYILKFDGASRGNPGLGGAGSVLYDSSGIEIWSESKFLGKHVTNNEAEYNALIVGLEYIVNCGLDDVLVQGDSKLVINQMNNLWEVKSPNLISLYQQSYELASKINMINFQHIYRNENKRADELANYSINSTIENEIKYGIITKDYTNILHSNFTAKDNSEHV
jgi:ribonuclease HI